VRDLFIARQFSSNQNDLKTITDLVCASSLFCFGLVLTGDFDNQKLYGELMKGFDKDNVMVEWGKIEMDSNTPALKAWMEEYMKSDEYYTSGEKIEWLEQEPENLPDIVRIARGPVQIMQVNIGQFNNAPGATFTDKSLNVKIEGNNGEYRKIQ
jgi:hypothetical protein